MICGEIDLVLAIGFSRCVFYCTNGLIACTFMILIFGKWIDVLVVRPADANGLDVVV